VIRAIQPDSGKLYREKAFPNAAPLTENDNWRSIDPRDQARIDCDRLILFRALGWLLLALVLGLLALAVDG
jgi:hypothetical protein